MPTEKQIKYWNRMKGKTGNGFKKGHGFIGGGSPKGKRNSPKTEFKKGGIPWIKGKHPIPWNKNKKTGFIPWNKGKRFNKICGSNHWNWKGGIDKWRPRERIEYKNWRKKVFENDNYTCWICEIKGGYLEAHHLKEWSKYPKLRYKVSNGMALHFDCHRIYTM